jgi:hypothetical protein
VDSAFATLEASPGTGLSLSGGLRPDHVSALSDARTAEDAGERVLVRAFDKAVRRKPLAFAADAGLWKLNAVKEERVAS